MENKTIYPIGSIGYNRVQKRKKEWKPFGKVLTEGNSGITYNGEEVFMEMLGGNFNTLSSYQQKRKKWHEEWKKRCREVDKMYERVEIDGVIYTRPRKTEKKAVYKPPVNKNPKKDTKENNKKESKYIPVHLRKNTKVDKKVRKNLIIRNVDHTLREDDLAELFLKYGDIRDITILRDKYTGESRGIAFVNCYREDVAQKILESCNKKPIGRAIISIDYAKDKKKR